MNSKWLPKIGLRKLKSILAMFIGFLIWQLIRIPFPGLELHPIYIYIYGVIEIRDSSAKTKELSMSRIKATFAALCVGLPLLALQDYLAPFVSSAFAEVTLGLALLLLATLLTLSLAVKVGCKTFCGVAAAICIILMVSHQDDGRYLYSILRSVQTLIGVGVAWLVNVKWFPYPGKPKSETST